MMNHQEITWTLAEWAAAARGGRVQQVRDDGAQTVLFVLRAEATVGVVASADPRGGRLHAQTALKIPKHWRVRLARLIEGGPSGGEGPLNFTAAARRWLVGKALTDVAQVPGERLVRLAFDGPGSDPGAEGFCSVVCALLGHLANLYLYDKDRRLICALNPVHLSQDAVAAVFSAEPLPRADGAASGLARNDLVAAHEGAAFEREGLAAARGWLGGLVRRAVQKQGKLVAALQRDLARVEDAALHKRHADLLAAHFHSLRRGLSQVTVEDFFDDMKPVTIPLDPVRTPAENLDRLYKRYRKYSAAAEFVLNRLIAAEARAQTLAAAQAALADASDWDALGGLARGWLQTKLLTRQQLDPRAKSKARPQQQRERERVPYRAFVSRTGRAIWVGRSASDNDTLTFRLARGNDAWFHVAALSGSHVIVRLGRSDTLDQETLLDAATLAAHFSAFAQTAAHKGVTAIASSVAALVEIHHTRCKFVRKPKGAAPGQVRLSGDCQPLTLRLEASRLQRLLSQAPESV